ncbi:tetratricopeptide repeat protein [Streptomyces sp. NBC_01451]|uniref:tetratricopeptide repeat protein n=1 Tax=Streptomyces sp. NBC_01451 TaxID=2903872 RepID=UPI002E352DCD|nr:tetratricopeptide repeat protein [Streptomyces sp. NBC_01451]
MPPRTNDSAPDREQAPQPPLTRPGRELGSRPTDTAGAAANLGTVDAGDTDGHTGAALSVPAGTDVPGRTDVSTGTDTAAPGVTEPAGADEAGDAEPGSGRTQAPITASAPGPNSSEQDSGALGTASPASGLSDPDERVTAVRRLGESSRRWRAVQLGACAAALAVAFTAGAVVLGAVRDEGGTATVASAPAAMSPALLASGDIGASIASLQAHLRAQPKDFGSWATLGLAYVEQARTKGDPSRYPQAQQALNRSLKLEPDNDPALAGRAALAAARHDFPGALKYSDQALAQNPYSERALSTRIDALVELGRYDEALKATDEADAKRPGVPVFTRYAYVRELRGDVTTARRVLEQALGSATSRGDIAYVSTALGQLAWSQGEYKSALEHFARALAADDAYLPALEGRARAQFADGDRAGAIKGMEDVVSRYPLPGPLVELGELYEVRGGEGDSDKARDQYALVNAWTAIARANGVNADLDTALAAADHGDKKSALRAARAEWDRRETVHTADALAWALHVNGHDEEALPYARHATATGYRNASFLYHRGMIEQATGHAKEARTSLSAALELNPGFSPLGARKARTALKSLEAAK